MYRVESSSINDNETRVTLMQESWDKGRDVIVHKSGDLKKIIQCKKKKKKISDIEVGDELVKLALFDLQDGSILGEEVVDWEMWCSTDFTENAAALIDTWPNKWDAGFIRERFESVTFKLKSLKDVEWSAVKNHLENDFPQKIRPRKLTGLDVSQRVREVVPVLNSFFVVKIVVDIEHIPKILGIEDKLKKTTISDEDVANIVSRIEAYPPEYRIRLSHGYCLGISASTLSLLDKDELSVFIENCIKPITDNAKLMMQALHRLIMIRVEQLAGEMTYGSNAFLATVVSVIGSRAVVRFTKLAMPSFLQQGSPVSNIQNLSIDQLLEKSLEELWEGFKKTKHSYDPGQNERGSTEWKRSLLMEHLTLGVSDKDSYLEAMRADFQMNRNAIEKLDAEIRALTPENFMVIADSKTAFEDASAIDELLRSWNRVEERREETKATRKEGSDSVKAFSPRLDKVTWATVKYGHTGALWRGYNAALIFRGHNFHRDATWTYRRIGETGPPSGRDDYSWRQPNLLNGDYFEVSVSDNKIESPLSWSVYEYCVRNPDGKISNWRKFEYELDIAELIRVMEGNYEKGKRLFKEGKYQEGIEPLRKAQVFSDRLMGIGNEGTIEKKALWNRCLDEASRARLRYTEGDRIVVVEGKHKGRAGLIEKTLLRHSTPYCVRDDSDGKVFYIRDEDIIKTNGDGKDSDG
ncbi:hypothetical protein ACFL51_01265 [Myxococcota bacterium]